MDGTNQKPKWKVFLIVFLLVLLHVAVALAALKIYCGYQERSEERRLKKSMAQEWYNENGEEISNKRKDALSGMIFEYEATYKFKNSEDYIITGRETYYWDGKKFKLASDFLKN